MKYQVTVKVLLELLNSPDHTLQIGSSQLNDIYFDELVDLGILSREGMDVTLHPQQLAKYSTVVPDEVYDQFMDINWLREQRKKLGMIQGKVKGEEYRKNQQERRKKRRAYAKQKRAERLAQPPEKLPLSEIIF